MRSFILLLVIFFSTATYAQSQSIRIIALAPHIVENLYAIGAGDLIVGTVDYADYPSEAKLIPRIGGYYGISLEKVLALKPDIVLAWKGGNKALDLAQLERLGIKVHFSNPTSLNDIADDIRHLGEVTEKQIQANKVASEFSRRLANITLEQSTHQSVSVFYQLWSEPMMTAAKGTAIDQIISLCKGDNVFSEASTQYPQISIENVVITKPQIIITPQQHANKPQPEVLWNEWPEIPAVKNQQFISINADLLHRLTPRVLTGVQQLCDKINNSREYYKMQKNNAIKDV
ncbi:cobalamin-binding protein [Pseudoalteromonas sp. MMG010]|uniref:cobalamin-binding protein n=1 Tax=Pseudoalteromonas sp. MMG010 TaxID=2822685 RepID=UPI001B3A43BA|nr:cobalamin-binding protein [Pseudoalteromonas sp. MMG010]MBQ4832812.1 cobalamin-binding protein [Pseudoalteromonas sp. MMG010]